MVTKEFKFENGDAVLEKITGFTGTITGTCFYLTGCNQYLVTAKAQNHKEPISLWYDEGRLELVKSQSTTEEDIKAVGNGCDILPTIGKRGA